MKPFWIKERTNQNGTYFVAMGRLSNAAAKRYLKPLHGSNRMHSFANESDYRTRLNELSASGENVHDTP